jgi:hypothetical protein
VDSTEVQRLSANWLIIWKRVHVVAIDAEVLVEHSRRHGSVWKWKWKWKWKWVLWHVVTGWIRRKNKGGLIIERAEWCGRVSFEDIEKLFLPSRNWTGLRIGGRQQEEGRAESGRALCGVCEVGQGREACVVCGGHGS